MALQIGDSVVVVVVVAAAAAVLEVMEIAD